MNPTRGPNLTSNRLAYLLPELVVIAYYAWIIHRARRRLSATLRGQDAASFARRSSPS